jgi:hypothetical protein
MARIFPRIARNASSLALGLLVATLTGIAGAADKSPVSSLPSLPAPHDETDTPNGGAVAGLTVKPTGYGSYVELVAAKSQGYCLVASDAALRLQDTSSSSGDGDLWRLEEDATAGEATLERTRFAVLISDKKVWVKSRARIALRAVARADGLTVWAFREANGDVFLLARGADGGRESEAPPKKDDFDALRFVGSQCKFGATRISRGMARAGAVARLEGALPTIGEGKSKVYPRYSVDASLSQFGREQEPMLAVRIHVRN